METQNGQIAPELVQILNSMATASGIELNDYVWRLIELVRSQSVELAMTPMSDAQEVSPFHPPRNEAMFAVLQETEELLKDMPVRGSTEETLKMIRRARAGEMWGYEPTDADTE